MVISCIQSKVILLKIFKHNFFFKIIYLLFWAGLCDDVQRGLRSVRCVVNTCLETCKNMGKKCVAAGCSNKHSDGVSLFLFPADENLRRQWTKQVQRTRACWKGPTENSCLCSNHAFYRGLFRSELFNSIQAWIKTEVATETQRHSNSFYSISRKQ